MQKEVVHKIDGVDYTFRYLNTSKALAIATEIGKRAAPVMAALVNNIGTDELSKLSKKEKSVKESESVHVFFEAIGSTLDSDAIVRLTKELCAVVACEAGNLENAGIFEMHFAGRPAAAVQVAAKSFEVNCGDFFALVGKAVSNRKSLLTMPGKTS